MNRLKKISFVLVSSFILSMSSAHAINLTNSFSNVWVKKAMIAAIAPAIFGSYAILQPPTEFTFSHLDYQYPALAKYELIPTPRRLLQAFTKVNLSNNNPYNTAVKLKEAGTEIDPINNGVVQRFEVYSQIDGKPVLIGTTKTSQKSMNKLLSKIGDWTNKSFYKIASRVKYSDAQGEIVYNFQPNSELKPFRYKALNTFQKVAGSIAGTVWVAFAGLMNVKEPSKK